jgi:hypothetical protein
MTNTGSLGWWDDSLRDKLRSRETSDPLADSLLRLQEALTDAGVQALPAFLVELERLRAFAWAKLSPPPLKDSAQRVSHDGVGALVDQDPELEYLSLHDLARRIDYAEGTIRNLMSQGVFKMGQHYVKPRGRILFKWPAIRSWLEHKGTEN